MGALNAQNGLVRNYQWGLDFSGTAQGTGGVGGLLAMDSYTNAATNHEPNPMPMAPRGANSLLVSGMIHATIQV